MASNPELEGPERKNDADKAWCSACVVQVYRRRSVEDRCAHRFEARRPHAPACPAACIGGGAHRDLHKRSALPATRSATQPLSHSDTQPFSHTATQSLSLHKAAACQRRPGAARGCCRRPPIPRSNRRGGSRCRRGPTATPTVPTPNNRTFKL